jgi:hypothetical protein
MTAKDGPPDGPPRDATRPPERKPLTEEVIQANRGPDKMPPAMASGGPAPTDRANSHNPKAASMLGTSGLHRGPWASGKARHEADQITTIVQPLIIDWSIPSGI